MRDYESEPEPKPNQSFSESNLPDCPLCCTRLTIQRIIPGRLGLEHWTLRCRKCGHIHQDAVDRSVHRSGLAFNS
jgi:uncharacterized Zn finger protein